MNVFLKNTQDDSSLGLDDYTPTLFTDGRRVTISPSASIEALADTAGESYHTIVQLIAATNTDADMDALNLHATTSTASELHHQAELIFGAII